jgi:hypothetical protein
VYIKVWLSLWYSLLLQPRLLHLPTKCNLAISNLWTTIYHVKKDYLHKSKYITSRGQHSLRQPSPMVPRRRRTGYATHSVLSDVDTDENPRSGAGSCRKARWFARK